MLKMARTHKEYFEDEIKDNYSCNTGKPAGITIMKDKVKAATKFMKNYRLYTTALQKMLSCRKE